MDCTIPVAKSKALISFAVTAKLIWVFVFAYTKSRFSHDAAHFENGIANEHRPTWAIDCVTFNEKLKLGHTSGLLS